MQDGSTSTSIKQPENITRMDPRLYDAAAEGDIKAFKDHADLLLLRTPNKNTLLHIHINAQSEDPIKKKTAQCEETESTPNFSQKAEECIEKESTSFVEEILRICPSLLSEANANGEIPLHLAARYGFSNMVEILLEHAKGDPEKGIPGMTNKHGDTALHEAVRFNHLEVVKLLTKEPDFPHSANLAGETPLYLAAERRFDTLVTEILRNCPATHGGPNGRTALHAAVINYNEALPNLSTVNQTLQSSLCLSFSN